MPKSKHERFMTTERPDSIAFSWSYSRDSIFRFCKRAYFYKYYGVKVSLANKEWDRFRSLRILSRLETESMWLGREVHNYIADILRAIKNGAPISKAEIRKRIRQEVRHRLEQSEAGAYAVGKTRGLLNHHYGDGSPHPIRKLVKKVTEAVLGFMKSEIYREIKNLPNKDSLEIEVTDAIFLDGRKIFVQLDCTYKNHAGYKVIIDWKTGKTDPFQLEVYRWYAENKWPAVQLSVFAYGVISNKAETCEFVTSDARKRIAESCDEMMALLQDGQPLPIERFPEISDRRQCMYCPYQAYCFPNQLLRHGIKEVFPVSPKSADDSEKKRLVEAIAREPGPLFVLAGPGTGKTEAAAKKVAILMNEQGVSPKNILCMTFTRSAVKEIRDRLRAEHVSDYPVVSTLHSFLLSQGAMVFPEGFRPGDFEIRPHDPPTSPQVIIKNDVCAVLNLKPSEYNRKLKEISFYRHTGTGAIDDSFVDAFDSALKSHGAINWGHIAYFSLEKLRADALLLEKVREQFQYFIGDEFQDFSPIEQELFRIISQPFSQNTYIFADDDQTIYSNKCCSPQVLRSWDAFPKKFLSLCSRSHERVLSSAEKVISCNDDRIPNKPQTVALNKGTGCIKISRFAGSNWETKFLVAATKAITCRPDWCKRKKIGLLITPAVRSIVNRISKALKKAGIEHYSQDIGDNDFELFRFYLFAVIDEGDGLSLRKVLINASQKMEIFIRECALPCIRECTSLVDAIIQRAEQEDSIKATLELLRKWRGSQSVSDLIDQMLIHLKLAPEKMSDTLARFLSLLKEMSWPLDRGDILIAERKLEDRNKIPKIMVTTVHSAKGFGADYVLVPGFEEVYWPSDDGRINEVRRLLYVGITRARSGVYFSWAKKRAARDEKDDMRGTRPKRGEQELAPSSLYKTIGFSNPVSDSIG